MYDSSNKSHKKIHLEWSLSMARIDFGSKLNQYKQKKKHKNKDILVSTQTKNYWFDDYDCSLNRRG